MVSNRSGYSFIQNTVKAKYPFNDDIIHFKEHEDVEGLITSICQSLEAVQGFKLLDVNIHPEREYYDPDKMELALSHSKADFVPYPLEQSRYLVIDIHYRLTGKVKPNEEEVMTKEFHKKIFYPELINGQYFYLKGNRFFPVMQLANAEFYRAQDSVVCKTMFMPVKIRSLDANLKDFLKELGANGYATRKLEASMFGKNIAVFKYYFSSFGPTETLKYFGIDDVVKFLIIDDGGRALKRGDSDEYDTDKNYYFRLTKNIFLEVDKEWFIAEPLKNPVLVQGLVSVFSRSKISPSKLYDHDYWFKKLGGEFTTNSNTREAKANSITISLERILDQTTRSTLRIPEADKEDIYTLIRYMILNYDKLIRVDNHNLSNRRVRVAEYLLYSLTKKLSDSVYRLINDKNITFSSLESIFSNIGEMFIIKKISTINLLRYNNNTSSLDLFSSTLKVSKAGPQTQAGSSANQSTLSKAINTSYVGKIDLTATSSGDPGVSGTMIPFAKRYDPTHSGKFFFTEEPEYEQVETNTTKSNVISISSSDLEDLDED